VLGERTSAVLADQCCSVPSINGQVEDLDHPPSGFAESLVSISNFELNFDLALLLAWTTFHCIIRSILIRLKSEQNIPDAQKQPARYHQERWDA
jgi:hypothetical protein